MLLSSKLHHAEIRELRFQMDQSISRNQEGPSGHSFMNEPSLVRPGCEKNGRQFDSAAILPLTPILPTKFHAEGLGNKGHIRRPASSHPLALR